MLDFISLFDTRTTILLVSASFFIQASAIGFQTFIIKEYEGVRTALFGNLSLAVGFFLNIFQGILPDWLTIIVSNLLLMQGGNLFYVAFSRFLGQSYNKKIIAILTGVLFVIVVYYTYITNNIGARITGASFIIGTSFLIAANQLWRSHKETYELGVWLTLLPLTTYGVFLYIRAVATIFGPPESIFSNTPIQTVTYLLLFLISFLWTIGFILMISQRLQDDLRELANVDTLTRIPNRLATQTFFENELSRIQRHGGEFSVLMIDIDKFKQINDSHGHALGDLALIKVADIFRSSVRKQDMVGRWGGEEFLMILPDTSKQSAQLLAERLRHQVENTTLKDTDPKIKVTISVGIASSTHTDSMKEILKKADDALYTAKDTRNTVIVSD